MQRSGFLKPDVSYATVICLASRSLIKPFILSIMPGPDPRSRPSLWAQVIPLIGTSVIEIISCITHARELELPHALESGLAAASALLALVSLYILLRGFREASVDKARAPPQSLSAEEEVDKDTFPMESTSPAVGLNTWTAWRRGFSIQSTDSVDPDSLAICMEDMII